jgi:hypothetical protein
MGSLKMKLTTKRIVFLLISISSLAACAENLSVSYIDRDVTMNPIVVQRALDSKIEFTSNQEKYQLIKGGQAVVKSSSEDNIAGQSAGSNLWSEQQGFYQLSIPGPGVQSSLSSSSVNSYQIAYNIRTGKIGIIVGQIVVKLKPNVTAESIASNYSINLIDNFKLINIAIYSVNDFQDIFKIAQELIKDFGVESVDLDIIENINKPL